jgi:deoxyribodipyrimidine photo-lyase
MPSLGSMGFDEYDLMQHKIPTGMTGGADLLDDFLPRMSRYDATRDFPAVKGPSYLSIHLRFGTVSIRSLARLAVEAIQSGQGGEGARIWLSELVWRDFYFMILHHHPHVTERSFKPDYDRIDMGKRCSSRCRIYCLVRRSHRLSTGGCRDDAVKSNRLYA